MKTKLSLVVLAAAAALSACGGGNGDNDNRPPPPDASDAVPSSASKSIAGMVAWIVALAGEDTEAKEPVKAETFKPPMPEDAEPSAVQ